MNFIDADLVVVPKGLRSKVKLGSVLDEKTMVPMCALTVPKQTGWVPCMHVTDLMSLAARQQQQQSAKSKASSAVVDTRTYARVEYVRPTLCCALDMEAFAKAQLYDDPLPDGQHIVVVAMYGMPNAGGTDYEPVAFLLAVLTLTTRPVTDSQARGDRLDRSSLPVLSFDRSHMYRPLREAAIDQLKTLHTFVIDPL